MRARELVVLVLLVILASALFSAAPATAARKTIGLDGQVRAVGFSKAVPGQLNYQGYLVDAADSSAVNATLEMTFRLFDSETKGAELWFETHPAVDVSNGLFQALLGSVTSFPGDLFDGTTLWLQTEVGAEVLSPRKPLVSVAYSHRSNSAEKLLDNTLVDLDARWVNEDQANSVTSVMITDGEIVDDDVAAGAAIDPGKIAGTAWTADNDGAGSGLDADLLDGQQAADFTNVANDFGRSGVSPDLYEGTTTLGDKYVAKADLDHLDAADGDPANAVYVDDAGKVGIGTTSPATELVVIGTSRLGIGSAYVEINNDGHLSDIDDPVTIDDDLKVLGAGNSSFAGNVGVGTTSPGERLDVNGTVRMTGFKLTTGATNGHVLTSDASGVGSWQAAAGGADGDWTIVGNDMYSAVSGNVGIGTTSPQMNLHIHKGGGELCYTQFTNGTTGSTLNDGLWLGLNGTGEAFLHNREALKLVLGTSNTARVTIDPSGNVGIGTGTPDYLLDVAGDAGLNQYLYHNGDENTYIEFTGDQIDMYTGGVQMIKADETTQDVVVINEGSADVDFRVESDVYAHALFVRGSDGNVGIGTGTPDYLLDVAGDAGFSQYIYHNGDENTYLRFTTDQIDMYAGGVWLISADEATQDEVVINEGSVDVDFRVESDNSSYALFVRGSDGRVGMGTSNPNYKLDVESSEGTAAHFKTTKNSNNAYGCYGKAEPSGNYDATGVYGVCTAADNYGYGVYGKGGFVGVRGYLSQTGQHFKNYYGVSGFAGLSGSDGMACGVYGCGSGGVSHYGVYYSGGLGGSGSKSAIVRTEEGPKAVYCQESPENWFEDFGSGQIHGGRAEIRLAHDFRQTVTVSGTHPMKVFITPNERVGEWWVEKGTTGFTLMAPEAPDGAKFDYRVVAKRQGYEDLRLQPAPAAYADHFLYPNVEEVPPEYRDDWLKLLPAEEPAE